MGDEWLLEEGAEHIFESCYISLENMPILHACLCMHAVILQCFFVMCLLTANGFCLHLLVPPLVQCCFFGASC